MTSRPPSPSDRLPDEPLAEVGREPLQEAIADARQERRGGISLQTLGVASAASAIASYTASHLWGPGTVASAALTPVVVALASEFLHRPINKVSATAQRVAPIPLRPSRPSNARPAAPAPPPTPGDWAPVSYTSAPPRPAAWRPRWRVVLLTGLLAFAIVVAVYAVPDVLAGHSVTGGAAPVSVYPSGRSAPAANTNTQTQTDTQTTTTTVPVITAPAESLPATTTATTPTTPGTAPGTANPSTLTAPPTGTPTTPTDPTTTPPVPAPGSP